MFESLIRATTLVIVLLAVTLGGAPAQDRQDRQRQQNHPGQFDFYVLALSWSPTFCQESAERGREQREQCGSGRPYAFVVHGLWPQYERGFPRACQVPAPASGRASIP